MNKVYVVKVGSSWQPWHKTTIKFEGTHDECLEWIKNNLKDGQHAYIDQVIKERM